MKNFSCTEDGVSRTATAAGARFALTGTNVDFSSDVMVDNPGPHDVYFLVGGPAVVATTASRRVPAGAQVVYDKGQGTHIALLSPDGDQAVVIAVSRGQ